MEVKTTVAGAALASVAFLSACAPNPNDENLAPQVKSQIAAHLKTHKLELSGLAPQYALPLTVGNNTTGVAKYRGPGDGEGCGIFDVRLRQDRMTYDNPYVYCP